MPKKKEQLKLMARYVGLLRTSFTGFVIRRTVESVDWEGNPISGLRPYFMQTLLIKPQPVELQALENTTKEVIEEHGKSARRAREAAEHKGRAFYLRFRVTHLCYMLREDPEWVPETLEEWEANKSSKLDIAVKLLLHHLGTDNRPPMKMDDKRTNSLVPNTTFVPTTPPSDAGPDRIVVYVAFPQNNNLIAQVLKLHGIECYAVNGLKSQGNRDKALGEFQQSERGGRRVLLLSNVGAVGLNIPGANILIVLDQLWSHQELMQLVGRVWRPPQPKDVIVYAPVLEHSTDMFLSVLSFTKAELLSAFTSGSKSLRKSQRLVTSFEVNCAKVIIYRPAVQTSPSAVFGGGR
ncbi:hypothetical protein DICSQDRAFT_73286 [Dichomitus squalens LYAD-421 SS1]|uniref:Helicase C-terminal domain-containing protein n=1 Tax=Dichomitus squalens (strain LYAD-421) TaxID=732165 RepID=R7SHK3_DICSQ|nr:uncharacterized protein DICSQDRAFT_73286 [Dichomitus squalens LYAD-421 SS1]EJF55641.1 hypothetical protein DICSQDRAFT_73286 [Dichomitus squalens LYAD-421 SS1]